VALLVKKVPILGEAQRPLCRTAPHVRVGWHRQAWRRRPAAGRNNSFVFKPDGKGLAFHL